MREHLGLDVDAITEHDRRTDLNAAAEFEAEMDQIYDGEFQGLVAESSAHAQSSTYLGQPSLHNARSFNHDAQDGPGDSRPSSSSSSSPSPSKGKSVKRDTRVHRMASHNEDVEGFGADHWKYAQEKGEDLGSDSAVLNGHEVLLYRSGQPAKSSAKITSNGASHELVDQISEKGNDKLPPPKTGSRSRLPTGAQLAALPVLDDTDIGGPPVRLDDSGRPSFEPSNPLLADIIPAKIDQDCMRDPANPAFWDDIWTRVARNNTVLYRRVFRCMPDNEVTTWREYHECGAYADKFAESMFGLETEDGEAKPQMTNTGSAAAGIAAPSIVPTGPGILEKLRAEKAVTGHESVPKIPTIDRDLEIANEKMLPPGSDQPGDVGMGGLNRDAEKTTAQQPPEASSPVQPAGKVPFPDFDGQPGGVYLETQNDRKQERRTTFSASERSAPESNGASTVHNQNSTKRRRRATTKGSRRTPIFPYDVLGREDAEELCNMIQGHLVQFPYDWLEGEEKDSHWLYQADLLAPKEI
jgi:phospholipase D1/2